MIIMSHKNNMTALRLLIAKWTVGISSLKHTEISLLRCYWPWFPSWSTFVSIALPWIISYLTTDIVMLAALSTLKIFREYTAINWNIKTMESVVKFLGTDKDKSWKYFNLIRRPSPMRLAERFWITSHPTTYMKTLWSIYYLHLVLQCSVFLIIRQFWKGLKKL